MGFLKLQNWYKAQRAQLFTACVKKEFGSFGQHSLIFPPFHSHHLRGVFLGDGCSIHAGSWIDCIEHYGAVAYNPRIDIGDGTYLGHRTHIIACEHMRIGKNVLCADGIYISDNLHGFEDINSRIIDQPLTVPGPVTIEDEVWLGEHVCVLPNVTIGKHSVIGSNSVVTKDIPEYSVAVGVPAKVIKSYNPDTKQWERG